jgi:cyclopropane fatty-acyl-phospholipid synthase-like methyltransferase
MYREKPSFIDFSTVTKLSTPTTFFERQKSQKEFWDNAHISQKLLEAHLDPNNDRASRRPETTEKCVDWITEKLQLTDRHRLIDLGCGPGLYTNRFAQRGIQVTGIDYSRRSIEYAQEQAIAHNMLVEYIYQDYTTIDYQNDFHVAMMIYCDFGVFSDEDRSLMLNKIHTALKPGGVFLFDVWTDQYAPMTSSFKDWAIYPKDGFFLPIPHIELVNQIHYPEAFICLTQYTLLDYRGTCQVVNFWERYYTLEQITSLLERHHFKILAYQQDFTGTPFSETSEIISVIAQKVEI